MGWNGSIIIKMDNNYEIEVLDSEIVVIGCDCSDSLSDPVRVAKLRDALTAWLRERPSDHGE